MVQIIQVLIRIPCEASSSQSRVLRLFWIWNLEELLQLSERTLKKSQVHKQSAQIDLTYETALWVTAALLRGGSALAMTKKGGAHLFPQEVNKIKHQVIL